MVTERIKELEATRAKIAELEQAIAAELNRDLAALPSKYGFESVDAFNAAVCAASGKRRGRKPGSGKAPRAPARGKRRKRAVITDETRASVKSMVNEGKTGGKIAKSLGISLPSVQNMNAGAWGAA